MLFAFFAKGGFPMAKAAPSGHRPCDARNVGPKMGSTSGTADPRMGGWGLEMPGKATGEKKTFDVKAP